MGFTQTAFGSAKGAFGEDTEPLPDPPTNLVPPTISSSGGEVGATVQLDAQGEWDGTVDSRSYQWLLDSVEISGQTGTSIETSSFGPGNYSLVETATNAGGSNSAESDPVPINPL
jgi:hypothetical protein